MSSTTQQSGWIRSLLANLLVAGANLVMAVSAIGFAGSVWWGFDLASHFRVQYLLMLTLAGILLIALKRRRPAAVFLVAAVVNLLMVVPLYARRQVSTENLRTYRVLLANVNTSSTSYDLVKQYIESNAPDYVLLEEVDALWWDEFRSLETAYPYTVVEPRSDNFGIALLSKHRFITSSVVYLGGAGLPSALARVRTDDGRALTILGTHPLPPFSAKHSEYRNEQLAAIPGVLSEVEVPILVVGDLNTSPWSPYFRRLLKDGGLRDSSVGFGFQPTWPTHIWPLLMSLDHCLYLEGVAIVGRFVGPNIGSNHYPLIVDFALAGGI